MYINYNANPLNKTSSSDCAIRAISKALCKPYDDVYTDLFNIGFEMKNLPNAQSVYERYFKETGYVRNKQPKKSDNTKYSVSEFASLHNKGVCIITIQGHMTVVIDGDIYDTWDCSNGKICLYYTPKLKEE